MLKALISLILAVSSPLAALSSSSAYLSSTLSAATGDGTIIWVPFDTTTFDDPSAFNLANGTYVAPGDGTLIINGQVEVSKLTASHTNLGIVVYNSTTGEQRYMYAIYPYPLQNAVSPGYVQLPYACTVKCSEGDVYYLLVFVSGGTKVVDLVGGYRETRFSLNFFSDP